MRLEADIHKRIGNFGLDVCIRSDAARIGILGASGSGKSMTLRCIAGIETPDSGKITLGDNILYDSERRIDLRPQKRRIGYMFQNYALFPTMTVAQNIEIGARNMNAPGSGRMTHEECRRIAGDMIRRFHLEGLEDHLPSQLSGGQQQRTALARIMAYKPDVILLDEPFSALDVYLKDQMQREMLEMLSGYDGQVIMVSHSRDEIYRFSDELYVIQDGTILAGGMTDTIFSDPGILEVARLTGCKNLTEARRRDLHCLEVPGWGITLHLKREIPEDVKYIGYRAHYFIPVWRDEHDADGDDCIRIGNYTMDKLPFEWNYYIDIPDNRPVCWFVQKDMQEQIERRGMPDSLRLEEDQILFLR